MTGRFLGGLILCCIPVGAAASSNYEEARDYPESARAGEEDYIGRNAYWENAANEAGMAVRHGVATRHRPRRAKKKAMNKHEGASEQRCSLMYNNITSWGPKAKAWFTSELTAKRDAG
jgi:hypothetical protein